MDQIHKKFSTEQVKFLFDKYIQGLIDRSTIEEVLGIKKARFYVLLNEYKTDQSEFTIEYHRNTPKKITITTEKEIEKELILEKSLIVDPALPITNYNYSAIKDRLLKKGITVSLPTIIKRAKSLGCYQSYNKTKKVHDREVTTNSIGDLIQHDASHHKWSPYASLKWVLITSIDDYSRKLLYADFFEQETTWIHIKASEALIKKYGIPLRYYVDSLRVFRFVQKRDSIWKNLVLQTDDANPQWKQLMKLLGIEVIHALSPQAKGKIERPYRWLQDRIVRTCAIEKITNIDEARGVLKEEVDRYNNHQVHSTTKEIPSMRFNKAKKESKSLFRKFVIPKPYTNNKDIFCLRERRITDSYHKIHFHNHKIQLLSVPIYTEVEIHMVCDINKNLLEIRIWWNNKMSEVLNYPLNEFPAVHF